MYNTLLDCMMMTRNQVLALFGALLCLSNCAPHATGPRTVVDDAKTAHILLGEHDFSLQWVSWDDFGVASVTKTSGLWRINGRQDSKENDDYITIDGVITEISAYEFIFDGTIVTRIHHIAGGNEVIRKGLKTFRMTRGRPYWRMMEMNNPSDSVVDYIDVFVRRPK